MVGELVNTELSLWLVNWLVGELVNTELSLWLVNC